MAAGAPLASDYSKGGLRLSSTRKETPQERYHKAHTIGLSMRLFKRTEQDIIEKLESVPNKAGYIKQLIRDDIKKNGGN